MTDSRFVEFGFLKSSLRFDKNKVKYTYVFGKIVRATIFAKIYKKEGIVYLVRTEHGNLRHVNKRKIFNSREEAEKFLRDR